MWPFSLWKLKDIIDQIMWNRAEAQRYHHETLLAIQEIPTSAPGDLANLRTVEGRELITIVQRAVGAYKDSAELHQKLAKEHEADNLKSLDQIAIRDRLLRKQEALNQQLTTRLSLLEAAVELSGYKDFVLQKLEAAARLTLVEQENLQAAQSESAA